MSILSLSSIICRIYLFGFCYPPTVTYHGIGTFTLLDFFDPKYRPVVVLPQSPDFIDPTFSLYTRKNPFEPDRLDWDNTALYENTHFNPKLKTKFIVHGLSEIVPQWMTQMKDLFLEAEDLNVITVSWLKGDNLPYSQAVANTRVVGAMSGIVIKNLCKKYDISPSMFHFLGHSLGSHVAGYAGKYMNGTLGRITGLDPAGPFFEGLKDTRARLWHTDAQLVDSIHTGAHLIGTFGPGMYETCSHVDIYVNGGSIQPGCEKEIPIRFIIDGPGFGTYNVVFCHHLRSRKFYAETILPTVSTPVAYLCNDVDSFERGTCINNRSETVVLGENMLKANTLNELRKHQGKRFFMATDSGLFGEFFKFQYLIKLKMASNPLSMKIIPSKVMIRFMNNKTLVQDISFADKKFHDELEYTGIFVLNIDPEELHQVHLKWSYPLAITSSRFKINIHSLEITTLSYRGGLYAAPIRQTFIPGYIGIPNGEWILFEKTRSQTLFPSEKFY